MMGDIFQWALPSFPSAQHLACQVEAEAEAKTEAKVASAFVSVT